LKGEAIPPEHHLALHCQPAHLLERDENGQPSGVSWEVFRVDEDGISTNWIEFQGQKFDTGFAEACLLLTSTRTVRRSHMVGVLRVVDVLAAGKVGGKTANAIHDPREIPFNPGHALITGIAADDRAVLDGLSAVTVLHPFTPAAIQRSATAESARRART
jgi:hypothetical protein